MARILQNEDIALLFGVFHSYRKLVHLMKSSHDVITRHCCYRKKLLYFLSNMNIIEFESRDKNVPSEACVLKSIKKKTNSQFFEGLKKHFNCYIVYSMLNFVEKVTWYING